MDRFITIENKNGSMIYIDRQDIVAVLELDQGLSMFYTLQDEEAIRINRSEWIHDLDYIQDILAQSGKAVTSLPLYEYNGEKTVQSIISPEHVEAVVVYKIHDNDTTVCVEAYIDGCGQLRSFTVPVEEAKKFVEDVYAVKPNLVPLAYKEGSKKPDALQEIEDTVFIDPQAIRSVRPNGYDMRVAFNSGLELSNFFLDTNGKIGRKTQAYFTKLMTRLKRHKTDEELLDDLGGDLNVLFPRLDKKSSIYRKRLREEFADAVVVGASQALERIQNTTDVNYLNIDTVSSFHFTPSNTDHDSCVRACFVRGTTEKKDPYPEGMSFYFETDEKAKAEIARLTKLKQQRKLA